MSVNPSGTRSFYVLAVIGPALLALACGGKATEETGRFEVYGRVVYRIPAFGSVAEFYINGEFGVVRDAVITVDNDTIPLIDELSGFYSRGLEVASGDMMSYRVESSEGSLQGTIMIPDTVAIIEPEDFDTLYIDSSFSAVWRKSSLADGYYAYLEYQDKLVAAVTENNVDTAVILPGDNFLESGSDYFWVEVLKGDFVEGLAPRGRPMPRGVVGAAGSYREVYVAFSR